MVFDMEVATINLEIINHSNHLETVSNIVLVNKYKKNHDEVVEEWHPIDFASLSCENKVEDGFIKHLGNDPFPVIENEGYFLKTGVIRGEIAFTGLPGRGKLGLPYYSEIVVETLRIKKSIKPEIIELADYLHTVTSTSIEIKDKAI